jgi:hypothetical protein
VVVGWEKRVGGEEEENIFTSYPDRHRTLLQFFQWTGIFGYYINLSD